MVAKTSTLCLEIRLPRETGGPIEVQSTEGSWQYKLGVIPSSLTSKALWEHMTQHWDDRRDIALQTGSELGQCLFDQKSTEMLSRCLQRHHQDDAPMLRIALRVPQRLADFPWEIAGFAGVSHIGVHPSLAVVRTCDKNLPVEPVTGQMTVNLVGVQLNDSTWGALDTGKELEMVRLEIEAAFSNKQFSVEPDYRGDWQALEKRYSKSGPPHVFHFAGHGLADGKGLVFRGTDGTAEHVDAGRIVNVLTDTQKERRTQLVFLNACHSAAAGKGPYQPYGGLAAQLIAGNIPIVVGMQAPVHDNEAKSMAKDFYKAVGDGYFVDCAVQKTRMKLYRLGGEGIGWAFLTLQMMGQPSALYQKTDDDEQRASYFKFGHIAQRTDLDVLLSRKSPLVVVTHGEARSGHRHVLERVQWDLEREGRILWRPVSEMDWAIAHEEKVMRSQLAGKIACALGISDAGILSELENRIAKQVAERCVGGRVVVIDLVETLTFHRPEDAQALLTLIHDLFADIMLKADRKLPVFLLISIAYLAPPRHNTVQSPVESINDQTRRVIQQLEEATHLKGDVLVEVLEELEPFKKSDIKRYLTRALNLSSGEATRLAEEWVLFDNEAILEKLKRLMDEE